CGIEAPDSDGWEQDPDTLDTWFSSGLWTFSTLGWPDTEEWEKEKIYHPTSVLETGYDIIFFWVARMILMSEYLLGEIPFKHVYLHGLVRDEQGRKMSKSLGNIIDPLDVISEYGADAMRLSLVIGSTPGNDSRLSKEKILSYRNFVNKLWNMGRYITTAISSESLLWNVTLSEKKSDADLWILNRLGEVKKEVTKNLESYNISLAAEMLRDFTWNEYADWYIEIHKVEKNDTVLVAVFNELLRMWHPFMPFVTEALYQSLYPNEKLPLMVQSWTDALIIVEEAPSSFQNIIDLITRIRNVRAIYHIDPKGKPWLTIVDKEKRSEQSVPLIKRLARLEEITLTDSLEQPDETARIMIGNTRAFLHLGGVIDIEKERVRISKEKEQLEKYKMGIERRLNDPHFTGKAPKEIIDQNTTSLEATEKKLQELEESLMDLSA